MSAVLTPTSRSVRGAWRGSLAATLVLGAGASLAGRAWFLPPQGIPRVATATTLFAGILVASLLVPARREDARIPPVVAGAIGLVAIGGAAAIAGPSIPLPVAAWTLPLVLLAAVAEEALFRRVAYGELARWGAFVAVVGSAVLFAAIHIPLYGVAALPVDLGAGLVFGWQRWATGSWGTSAATHAAANVVAVLR
jgi:membrane protease YdiL (CAAX protease family)